MRPAGVRAPAADLRSSAPLPRRQRRGHPALEWNSNIESKPRGVDCRRRNSSASRSRRSRWLGTITVPTLLMTGDADLKVQLPPSVLRLFAARMRGLAESADRAGDGSLPGALGAAGPLQPHRPVIHRQARDIATLKGSALHQSVARPFQGRDCGRPTRLTRASKRASARSGFRSGSISSHVVKKGAGFEAALERRERRVAIAERRVDDRREIRRNIAGLRTRRRTRQHPRRPRRVAGEASTGRCRQRLRKLAGLQAGSSDFCGAVVCRPIRSAARPIQ